MAYAMRTLYNCYCFECGALVSSEDLDTKEQVKAAIKKGWTKVEKELMYGYNILLISNDNSQCETCANDLDWS
jgi:hypothetical protein